MKRIEIVMNQAIEEDFFELCNQNKLDRFYTKYSNVCGEGNQIPKHGSPIWPQLNTTIVLVCDEDKTETIKEIVTSLREEFPDDGVFCAISDVEMF